MSVYGWRQSAGMPSLPGRHGQQVKVITRALQYRGDPPKRGPMNLWIRFADGYEAIVPWRSIRKDPPRG